MKHTPGPWTFGDENNSFAEINIGETVATFCRTSPHNENQIISRDEMLANAKLCMAAPDLLLVALSIQNAWDNGIAPTGLYYRDIVSKAIKKATE